MQIKHLKAELIQFLEYINPGNKPSGIKISQKHKRIDIKNRYQPGPTDIKKKNFWSDIKKPRS